MSRFLKKTVKTFLFNHSFSSATCFYNCVLSCLSKSRWTYFCNWRYINYLLTYLLRLPRWTYGYSHSRSDITCLKKTGQLTSGRPNVLWHCWPREDRGQNNQSMPLERIQFLHRGFSDWSGCPNFTN